MKSFRTTVSLSQEQYKQLQALADTNNLSVFPGKVAKEQNYNPLAVRPAKGHRA